MFTLLNKLVKTTSNYLQSGVLAQQKFCPSATEDRPKCEADLLQYKCGVFFLDLPEREHLSWIGGLPDIFKKRVIVQKFHRSKTVFPHIVPVETICF